jgi:hypothetical protein
LKYSRRRLRCLLYAAALITDAPSVFVAGDCEEAGLVVHRPMSRPRYELTATGRVRLREWLEKAGK